MSYPYTTDQKEAINRLRELGIKPGSTIWTNVDSVARSGMSRRISCYFIKKNNPYNITYWVARALECSHHRDKRGMLVHGCGMDMGFHVVYSLGRMMFRRGASVKHSQRRGQEERLGNTRETDGGYLLNQRWL